MRRYACLDSNNKITLLRPVDNDEYTCFSSLSCKFGIYLKEAGYYTTFDKAYKELIDMFETYSQKGNFIETTDINRYTMNYLLAVRTFLDHWEAHIKREYRGNQKYIELFKNSTGNEYDNHMSYRIVYRLRNYVQHCEMPISSVTGRLNSKHEKELFIYVNKDRLLSNFKEWKPEEVEYLKSLDKEFEILPFFEETNQCLFRIHNQLTNFNVNKDFMLDCISVLKLRKQFKEHEGILAIVEYSDDEFKMEKQISSDDIIKMNIKQLPASLCENILKQHICKNEAVVKMFNFSGTCIGETGTGFPCIVDKDESERALFIKGKEIINVNKKRWVRLLETTYIGKINKYISVYADAGFSMKELTELSNFYDSICKVLY